MTNLTSKNYRLPVATLAQLDALAPQHGGNETAVIVAAVAFLHTVTFDMARWEKLEARVSRLEAVTGIKIIA